MKGSVKAYLMVVWVALLLTAAEQLLAQGTDLGTIRGTVIDISGGVVPGAEVVIIDLSTNQERKLSADENGNYEASSLKSGTYKVRFSLVGFDTYEVLDIVLRSGGTVRADAKLQPTGNTESIVVTSEAATIQTETPTVAATLDSKLITELPRDSRNIYDFLYLNSNITQSGDGSSSFKFLGAQSYGANFSLDGQKTTGSIFGNQTDSQPSLESVGELMVMSNNFSAEYGGIANIRVVTKRGSAQHHGSLFYNNRNSALDSWDLASKRSLANFVPSPDFPSFNKPYYNLTETGGSFGGPVPFSKGKTFFLGSYEKRWYASPISFTSTTRALPHATVLDGDFSLLDDGSKPVVPAGVALTADEVARDTVGGLGQQFVRIPSRLLNPITNSIARNYFGTLGPEAPINPVNGTINQSFARNIPGLSTRDLFTARIDHDLSDNDRIYGVFNFSNSPSDQTLVQRPFPSRGKIVRDQKTYTVSLSYTKIFTPNLINEARGGFNLQNRFQHAPLTLSQWLSGVGFEGSELDLYGQQVGAGVMDMNMFPTLSIGAYNGGFSVAQLLAPPRTAYRPTNEHSMSFGDTLTWIKGRHSLKTGADLVRNSAFDGFTLGRSQPAGRMNYSGSSPDAMASFLMGLPPTSYSKVGSVRGPMDVYNSEYGFFAQDDLKLNSRLTLNLGLRYELATPFIERNDLMVNFDPYFIRPDGTHGRFIVPSAKAIPYLKQAMQDWGVVTSDVYGVGKGLIKTDRNNFAPRLGAAWRLTDRMVLRGGLGYFFPTSAAQGIRDPLATNAFNQASTFNSSDSNPISPWPGGINPRGIVPLMGGTQNLQSNFPSFNIVPMDMQSPRISQFNFTFERELPWESALRVSYLGTRMKGLIMGKDLYMIPPSDQGFATTVDTTESGYGDGVTPCSPVDGNCLPSLSDMQRLSFPELGDWLSTYGNIGRGASNALQAEFKRRFSRGLMFNVTYTLLDQKSETGDTGNSSLGGTLYNQFDPRQDYGRDGFVSTHRLVAYGVYTLPIGKGERFGANLSKWANGLIGGWQLSSQGFTKSGTGFTPYWTMDSSAPPSPGNIASSALDATATWVSPSYRPILIGDPQTGISGDQFFNPAAFGLPSVGTDLFTNPKAIRRNALVGPSTWGTNLGIKKNFRIREAVNFEFGAEVDNLFNHPLKSPVTLDWVSLGAFIPSVNPSTLALNPLTGNDVTTSMGDFGKLIDSYSQEGIGKSRSFRFKLRLTF